MSVSLSGDAEKYKVKMNVFGVSIAHNAVRQQINLILSVKVLSITLKHTTTSNCDALGSNLQPHEHYSLQVCEAI
jgi:hypothetical protein